MALKDTMHKMCTMLKNLSKDLEKAERGNKAASQRVRTGSIKFGKVAKLYRKESVKCERGTKKKKKGGKKKVVVKRKPARKAKKPAKRKAPARKKTKHRKTRRR